MVTIRRRLDLSDPPRFSPEELRRLNDLTDDDVVRQALDDPDNPPLSDEELARVQLVRGVRAARRRTGLSQAEFARRFRINPARLKDWEQGRFRPDSVALAYLSLIRRDPAFVERALSEEPL